MTQNETIAHTIARVIVATRAQMLPRESKHQIDVTKRVVAGARASLMTPETSLLQRVGSMPSAPTWLANMAKTSTKHQAMEGS